jgi:hypothetical protein
MGNRIISVDLLTTRFDPAEAEFAVVVTPEQLLPDLELRGRFTGPKSPYGETIEVAYNLRPLAPEDELPRARVIIPEPSFWEPAAPFIYDGIVELWQAGELADRRKVSHGLRNLALRRHGLSLNGQLFKFRGARVNRLDESEARRLHEAKFNWLMTPVTAENVGIWEIADRYGFLVLGQVDATGDEVFWLAEEQTSSHISCFGWVLPQAVLEQRQVWHTAVSVLRGHRQQLLMGIRLDEPFTGVLPGEVSFVVCSEQLLPDIAAMNLPRIVVVKGDEPADLKEVDPKTIILGHFFRPPM